VSGEASAPAEASEAAPVELANEVPPEGWQPDALGAMNVGEAILEQEHHLSDETAATIERLRIAVWARHGLQLEDALELVLSQRWPPQE
jgi:hypothetical protein